jgi:hypothetical protein
MIKIKDYILHENDIRSIEKYNGYLRLDLKFRTHYLDIDATFNDIEWNYGTPQYTQRQIQKELCKSCYYRDTISNELKRLEEENKKLKNVINELSGHLVTTFNKTQNTDYLDIKIKLDELVKGEDKNEEK